MISKNSAKWKIFKELENIIHSSGLYIFGGYVRDKILHDYAARNFYTKYHEMKKNKSNMFSEEFLSYEDEKFLPEYKERTLLPKDIDTFGLEDSYAKLLLKLSEHDFNVLEKKSDNKSMYTEWREDIRASSSNRPEVLDRQRKQIKHVKLVLYTKAKFCINQILDLESFIFYIDVLYIPGEKNIDIIKKYVNRGCDFYCNSLILNPENSYEIYSAHNCSLNADLKLEKILSTKTSSLSLA